MRGEKLMTTFFCAIPIVSEYTDEKYYGSHPYKTHSKIVHEGKSFVQPRRLHYQYVYCVWALSRIPPIFVKPKRARANGRSPQ